MASESSLKLLDEFYASEMGCEPAAWHSGGIVVRRMDSVPIRFAKGYPLALYAIVRPGGSALAAIPRVHDIVREVLESAGKNELTDDVCDQIECAASKVVAGQWFRGIRFVLDGSTTEDRRIGSVHMMVPEAVEAAYAVPLRLAEVMGVWNAPAFVQIVDGKIAAWAAVKPVSDVVWDLSIETEHDYRGKGYARSVSSAAARYVLDQGKLVGWGTDRANMASIRTARAIGFREYGNDFGVIEREPVPQREELDNYNSSDI